jgi:hypothetical protein
VEYILIRRPWLKRKISPMTCISKYIYIHIYIYMYVSHELRSAAALRGFRAVRWQAQKSGVLAQRVHGRPSLCVAVCE